LKFGVQNQEQRAERERVGYVGERAWFVPPLKNKKTAK